jgi:TetR/AcrR family transcriptional regulator, transcriptional repressor for nem operon
MARPVEFDPEGALGAAIKVFASHGFEGSSTAELLARMGIARQSLYGAFGDKRRLFLKALERYNAASVAEFVTALGSSGDHLEALGAALLAFAKPGAEPDSGCLGLGSIAEFGRSDADINSINDASARTLLATLAAHIRDGVAAGEIGPVDPDTAAQFVLAVRSGLKVAARSGARLDSLHAIARIALRSLQA